MQELRLVAVSEDGSYAVLVVPGRSGRFALPIDERLRTVARGQFSRLAQYEIEVESPLRPKEIQDRIRAGETAEEIADAAGLPVDRIRRFEGPVLAEREFRAAEAQRATVRGPGEPGLGSRLGEVVSERLADIGVAPEDQEWDSRKRQDGTWQVQLAYTIGGRMHVAEWVYDSRSKHVTPDDDEAIRLCLDEAQWPGPRQAAPPAIKATVTPIGPRVAAAAAHPSEHRGEADRRRGEVDRPSGRSMPHPSRQEPATIATGTRQAAPQVSQVDPAEPGPFISQPAARAHADVEADPVMAVAPVIVAAENAPAVTGPLPAETEAQPASEPAPAPEPAPVPGPAPEATQDSEPAESAEPPQPSARPARRASGGRSRRSSVPSWDEIMLGNSRQPE